MTSGCIDEQGGWPAEATWDRRLHAQQGRAELAVAREAMESSARSYRPRRNAGPVASIR